MDKSKKMVNSIKITDAVASCDYIDSQKYQGVEQNLINITKEQLNSEEQKLIQLLRIYGIEVIVYGS